MRSIYIAQATCKLVSPRGMYGEITVVLGEPGTDVLDMRIECTFADFQVGKRYVINISEIEEAKTMP